jgi:prolipoprotein diacylglyceryltransferase
MHATSLLLGLGTLTGLLLACWRAPQKELPEYLDAGFWVLVGALIGSRAGSVLVNWAYYQAHAGEVFQVWKGGLSGIGALVGGVVAIFVVARWKSPALPCGCAFPAGWNTDGYGVAGMLGQLVRLRAAIRGLVGTASEG